VTPRFRARQLAHDLRANLLLRPAVITIALAATAFVFVELDQRGFGLAPAVSFIDDPAVAQTILGAVGGSMIGVVSIVYSVLVMSLTMASMQFSPRILAAFLRDPISQNVLGIFTGTFLYCLAALRGVRSDPPFVPSLTLAGAVALALTTIAALIYFINHIAREIQVNHLVSRIAATTASVIEQELPEGGRDTVAPEPPASSVVVTSARSGYVQLLDLTGLAAAASSLGVRIDIAAVPGDFVPAGGTLARIAPDAGEDTLATVRRAFDLGPVRTLQQDVAFGLRQIVDIGLKAISPAVNDPSTCATCIDHLDDLLRRLAKRDCGARVIREGTVIRLAIPTPAFTDYVALAFNQLRQYGRGDLAVANRLMRAFVDVAEVTPEASRRAALVEQGRLLMAGLDPRFAPEDRVELEQRYATLRVATGSRPATRQS
jgi:uncharacterized membrane protein